MMKNDSPYEGRIRPIGQAPCLPDREIHRILECRGLPRQFGRCTSSPRACPIEKYLLAEERGLGGEVFFADCTGHGLIADR